MTAKAMSRVHLWLTYAWAAAVIPTLMWWRESILWVAFMSLWANVASHWACWQAARAEMSSSRNNQVNVEQEHTELLRECVKDWRDSKLSHYSAMLVVAMIVCPRKPTEQDIQQASRLIINHPEWANRVFEKN